MDPKSAAGDKTKDQAPNGSAAPSSCAQPQKITARHKACTWIGVFLLVQAIIGTTIIPILCSVSDTIYSWMAGYMIGYSFAAGAHELIAFTTGQPCEAGRYLAWTSHRSSLRSKEAVTLSEGVERDIVWFFSVATIALIGAATVALISITLMFQSVIDYTPDLTFATIIGAAVATEIVGPHVASFQSEKMSQLNSKT